MLQSAAGRTERRGCRSVRMRRTDLRTIAVGHDPFCRGSISVFTYASRNAAVCSAVGGV